jgi:hypothetical protein
VLFVFLDVIIKIEDFFKTIRFDEEIDSSDNDCARLCDGLRAAREEDPPHGLQHEGGGDRTADFRPL